MKKSKKITVTLIVAMVMTVAMVVMAYADYVHNPAWNSGTGRYTQVYDLTVGYNWKYSISELEHAPVAKMHAERPALVQCTSNGLTAFPTYYQVRKKNTSGELLTYEGACTGTGTFLLNYYYPVSPGTNTYLAIRTDPRQSTAVVNKGNWSPDNY